MRVRDLGALAVGPDCEPVRGTRAPSILARLALDANRTVSVEALMDAAWGDRVSPGAGSTLESHIWRLRRVLEPGRAAGAAPAVLVNDGAGYRLVGTAHTVDSLAFDRLAGDVRDLLATGAPQRALATADEALALWRGRPYGCVTDAAFAQAAVGRLDELHSQVSELRVEALLEVGDEARALADLENLIGAHPLRERLRALRMLALYRSGRSEEASAAYRAARDELVDLVGSEPGPELRELHRRVLAGDPGLLLTPRLRLSSPARRRTGEVHLPATLTRLWGRDDERRGLGRLVERHLLVTVTGPAGCGKTRLAVETVRAAAATFDEGVWFVDLTSLTDPEHLADLVVSTIGFAASSSQDPVHELRDYLRERRVLVVLDNCEHVLGAVTRLVHGVLGAQPGPEPRCRLLLTSREPLATPGEVVFDLRPLPLPPPDGTDSAAVELFLERVGTAAPAVDASPGVRRVAAEICRCLDGLPLALELAAARARSFSLADIAAQATADPGGFGRVGAGRADDHRTTLRSALDWSHDLLDPAQQRAHRRLAVLPGPFSLATAAAVLERPVGTTVELLAALVHRSMLVSDATDHTGGATAFHQLATVRAHAREALDAAGEAHGAGRRRDEWVTELVGERPRLGSTDEASWFEGLDAARTTLRATLASGLADPHDSTATGLPVRLTFYWYYRAQLVEALRWLRLAHERAVEAATADALPTGLALAGTLIFQGRDDLARPLLAAALDRVGDGTQGVEVGELMVGVATAAYVRDEADLLRQVDERLAEVVQTVQDPGLALLADGVHALVLLVAGRVAEAAGEAQAVMTRGLAAGNGMAVEIASGPLMVEAMFNGRPDDGIRWVTHVMQAHVRVGSLGGGMYVENRANYATQAGDFVAAARLYAAARTQTRRAGMRWPRRPLTDTLLQAALTRLGPTAFQRAWIEGEGLSLAEVVRSGGSVPAQA